MTENSSYWNFKAQKQTTLINPEHMGETEAREYVPQTPRAQKLFGQFLYMGKMNALQIVRAVNKIIFEGRTYADTTKQT